MKIALAQTCPVSAPPGPYSPSAFSADTLFANQLQNCHDAERLIQQAKAKGADVVCFPEYFLQGILNEGRQYASLTSVWLETTLKHYAKTEGIAITGTIVHGSSSALPRLPMSSPVPPSLVDRDDDTWHAEWTRYLDTHEKLLADESHFTLINEAFFIDSQGVKTGSYTKKNLWHPEREYLTAGTVEEPVFDTPWGKAGFLICWDLSHPAAAQQLARQGADLIFAPAYWLGTDSEMTRSDYKPKPNYELDLVQSLCSARAFETETVLLHTNAGGKRGEGFMGGSGVWAPVLGKVGGFEGDGEGLKIVEVDLGVLADARELYKIREDAAVRNAT